jgi:hypothetical protein
MEPIRFRCTACKHGLSVAAESAGKATNCTLCGAELTVPPADTPVQDGKPEAAQRQPQTNPQTQAWELVDDEPNDFEIVEEEENTEEGPKAASRGRSAREATEPDTAEEGHLGWLARLSTNWRRVRTGLLLMLVATGMSVGATVLVLLLGWVLPLSALMSMLYVTVVVTCCHWLLMLAARALCLFVSPRNSARKLAVAALSLESGLIVILIVGISIARLGFRVDTDQLAESIRAGDPNTFQGALRRQMIWLNVWILIMQFVGYATIVVYPLFLRAVAFCLHNNELAEDCLVLIKLAIASLIIGFISRLLTPIIFNTDGMFVWRMVLWLGSIVTLAGTIQSLLITIRLRGAILEYQDAKKASRRAISRSAKSKRV